MSHIRLTTILALLFTLGLLMGCSDESVELKQKIAEMEKRLQKQEKDVREFASKFSPAKDFSADIQRMEDQQDRIQQTIKEKVEPTNARLEEFRDWAQEAQKEREIATKKAKTLEQAVVELQKRMDAESKETAKLAKDTAAAKKAMTLALKTAEDANKSIGEVRKELHDNNERVIAAVKKTLPKVKEAAVADLKSQLAPLEQSVAILKTAVDNEKKALAGLRNQIPAQAEGGSKDVQHLVKRVRELEDIVSAQKAYLLEMGSKMHEVQQHFRTGSDYSGGRPSMSMR